MVGERTLRMVNGLASMSHVPLTRLLELAGVDGRSGTLPIMSNFSRGVLALTTVCGMGELP